MRRRTLLLLATPAVVAAMAVAVPALAGSSSAGGAHKSSVAPKAHTSAKCIVALVGKRRVRECLVAGPRGARGVRGFLGPNGPRGVQGKTGKQGATGEAGPAGSVGPPGTARGYALIQPESVGPGSSAAGLVPGQTVGINAIRRVLPGTYCLLPASGVNPTAEAPVASGEASHSGAEVVVPVAVVFAGLPNNCGSGELEVKTYNIPLSGKPELSEKVAFTIIVP